jgi:hypothetical protein
MPEAGPIHGVSVSAGLPVLYQGGSADVAVDDVVVEIE